MASIDLIPPKKPEKEVYSGNLVDDAKHIHALTFSMADEDGNIIDQDAVDEYNRSLKAFEDRYGVNPGVVPTKGEPDEDLGTDGKTLLESNVLRDTDPNAGLWEIYGPTVDLSNPPIGFGNEPTLDIMKAGKDLGADALTLIADSVPVENDDKAIQKNIETENTKKLIDNINNLLGGTENNASGSVLKPTQGLQKVPGIETGETPKTATESLKEDLKIAQDIASDVINSIPELGDAIESGIANAVGETVIAYSELVDWLSENDLPDLSDMTGGLVPKEGVEAAKGKLQEQASQAAEQVKTEGVTNLATGNVSGIREQGFQAETVTGNIVKSASQFLAGFIGPAKLIKGGLGGLKLMANMPKFNTFIASTVASASAGVTFNPQDENLFNLLKDWKGTPELFQPLIEYLSTNKDDPNSTNRLKQALANSAVGAAADGLFAGFQFMKSRWNMRGRTAGIPDAPIDAVPTVRIEHETVSLPQGIKEGDVQPNSKEFFQVQAENNLKEIEQLKVKLENAKKLKSGMFEQENITPLNDEQVKALERARNFAQLYRDKLSEQGVSASNKKRYKAALKEEEKVIKELEVIDNTAKEAEAKNTTLKEQNELLDKEIADTEQAIKENEDFISVFEDKIVKSKTSQEIVDSKKTKSTITRDFKAEGKIKTLEDIEKGLPIEEQAGKATRGFTTKEGQFLDEAQASEAAKRAAIEKVPGMKFVGKPGVGFLPKDLYDSFVAGKTGLKKLLDEVNIGSITSTDNIKEAIDRMAKLVKVSNPTLKEIPIERANKIAKTFGLRPKQLTDRNSILSDPAYMVGLEHLMQAARGNLEKLSDSILNNVDSAMSDTVLFHFLRSQKVYKAISAFIRSHEGDVRAANRLLKEMEIPTGTVAEQITAMRTLINKQGGAGKARRTAFAIKNARDNGEFKSALNDNMIRHYSDAAIEYWYFALLSNPITHAVNVGSTAGHLLYQIPVRAISAQANKFLKSPDGVAVGEAKAMTYAMMSSFKKAIIAAGKAAKSGQSVTILDKLDDAPIKAITADNLGVKADSMIGKMVDAIGMIVRTPTRALLAEDEFFKVMARDMEISAQAVREAQRRNLTGQAYASFIENFKRNPGEYVIEEADAFARMITFTEELGRVGSALQSGVKGLGFPARIVVPFIRTPVNLTKQALRNTPLGIFTPSVIGDLRAGGSRAQLAATKMALGGMVQMLVAHEVLSGNITGAGPADKGLNNTWRLTHEPFSIRIPNDDIVLSILKKGGIVTKELQDGSRWVHYDRIDPIGLILGATSSLTEAMSMLNDADYEKGATQIGFSIAESITEKQYFQSISDFLRFTHEPLSTSSQRWLQNTIGTFLRPAIVASATRLEDPVWRNTNNIIDTICSRTPGCSQTLPPNVNIWGQPYYSYTLGPDWISPFYQNVPDGKPINDWLWENQVPVKKASGIQMGVELTPQQRYRFDVLAGNELKIGGKGLYDKLNDIIEGKDADYSGIWKLATDGPDGGKARIVNKLIDGYRKAARQQLMKEDSTFKDAVIKAKRQEDYNLRIGPGELPEEGEQ